jgi:hypothetical protein
MLVAGARIERISSVEVKMSKEDSINEISRRQLLTILAASAGLLIGCNATGATSSSSSGSSGGTTSGNTACVLTPELTIGPYFVDEKLNRSDLTTDTTNTNVLHRRPADSEHLHHGIQQQRPHRLARCSG